MAAYLGVQSNYEAYVALNAGESRRSARSVAETPVFQAMMCKCKYYVWRSCEGFEVALWDGFKHR